MRKEEVEKLLKNNNLKYFNWFNSHGLREDEITTTRKAGGLL